MLDSLYITTNANATGKRLVALGVMELLARRYHPVAFFRPVVKESAETDQSISLMRARYQLDAPPQQMAGVSRNEARELLAMDRTEELLQIIQQRYKALQQGAQFTLVEGTSFHGFLPEMEFELNAKIAINLGCMVVGVYSAAGKSIQELVQSVRIGNESLFNLDAQIFATFVNRIDPSMLDRIQGECQAAGIGNRSPIYFLPEEPLLGQPTLREIQEGLKADVLVEDPAAMDREVTRLIVAAMQLPAFLERLVPDCLVITPGDRGDIVAGCTLSSLRPDAPSPAGVLLTGGLALPSSVRRLVQQNHGPPILSTGDDTFAAAKKASEVRAEIGVHAPRKIESAIGLFQRNIDHGSLAKLLQAPIEQHVTPLLFEFSLIQGARRKRVKIVLAEGTEPRILRAVEVLRRRDVAELILLGDPVQIRSIANASGVRLPDEGVEIIDPLTSPLRESFAEEYLGLRMHKGVTPEVARDRMQEVSYFGTMLVHRNMAQGMVSGAIHTTANTILPAFEFIKTKPGVRVVSSVFLMCLKTSVLVYGDCAVIPNPTAEELAEIGSSSADTAMQFGIEPRVAMLSYSTGESGRGEDVDRVRQATALLRANRPELLVEGPIQYDAAVDPEVAATKLPGSPLAGHATVLIFPDLNTGNNTYKAVQRTSGAVAIGPVLQGLRKPVNDLSRGCTVTDIVNTVAITAVQAQAAIE
jgi:phosphate acetyltransferase